MKINNGILKQVKDNRKFNELEEITVNVTEIINDELNMLLNGYKEEFNEDYDLMIEYIIKEYLYLKTKDLSKEERILHQEKIGII